MVGKPAVSWCPAGFCIKEQPTNQRSHSSCLSNQQSSAVTPVRCFQYTKEEKKNQVEPLFSLFSIWMSALLCCKIHWAREWCDTACRHSSLALPAKQDSYLLLPQSPFGQNLSQGLGFIGWWGGNSTRTEMEGASTFWEWERDIYLYTYIFSF